MSNQSWVLCPICNNKTRSNLNIIHILGSFLRPIREEVWKKRLHIGNIKKVYQDITIMKNRIL